MFANEGANVAILDRNMAGCEETIASLSRNHDNAHCAVTVDVSSEKDVVGSMKAVEVRDNSDCLQPFLEYSQFHMFQGSDQR